MPKRIDLPDSKTFSRSRLWYLKNNPDSSPEEMDAFFDNFKFSIFVDPEEIECPAHQVCLLTAVNVAARISQQPDCVQVFGVSGQKRNDNSGLPGSLQDAINQAGGVCREVHRPTDTLGIAIGKASAPDCQFLIRAVFEGWRGGIIPYSEPSPFESTSQITLGAILAAGLAVYECFKYVNDEGSATGHQEFGLSLWDLGIDNWKDAVNEAPESIREMSPIWFCGLGHLGQAYIWTLGHLPISRDLKQLSQITLQDGDIAEESNLSTSLLTFEVKHEETKTQICGEWLKQRHFEVVTIINEYILPESKINFGPSHVICGFDKRKPRRQVALRKPKLMIDAGIGGKPDDYSQIAMTVLPSGVDPRIRWEGDDDEFEGSMPATLKKHFDEGDERIKCGIELLNGKAVGFSFVGVITASIVIAELVKKQFNGISYQTVSLDISDMKPEYCLLEKNTNSIC